MKKIFIITYLKITNPVAYLIFAFLFAAIQPAITFLLFNTANWFLFIYKYVNGEYLVTGAIYMILFLYSSINISQLIQAYLQRNNKQENGGINENKQSEVVFNENNVIKRKSYSQLKEAAVNKTLEKDEKKEVFNEINKELNTNLNTINEKITELNASHKNILKLVDILVLAEQSLDDEQYPDNRENTISKGEAGKENDIFHQAKQVSDEYSLTQARKEIEKEKIDMSAMDETIEENKQNIEPEEKKNKRKNKLKNISKDKEEE